MNDTFTLFFRALWTCLQALPMTLLLTALSAVLGLCLAIPLAVIHYRRTTWKARLVRGFVYVFTGTPLLVQIYLIYYGLPSLDWVGKLMQQPSFSFLKGGFVWGLIALTLNTAAYSTVIFSGAIANTDVGEVEAARAYGMRPGQIMRRIILPSGLRRALPAYSNELIMTMHSTALVSTVTIMEVTNAAQAFVGRTYRSFIGYSAAAVIYLVLTLLIVAVFKWLEKRYMVHLRPHTH